jgi:putative transcriptional regulator
MGDIATMTVETRINDVLAASGKTLYWLAKETGISYNTLHRLQSGTSQGITFEVLDKICTALDCAPGDLLIQTPAKKGGKK